LTFDRQTTEYHLTPNGWVTGTYGTFGHVRGDERPRPIDALETWEFEVYQKSGWSREERNWDRTWKDPNVSDECIADLHVKFPFPK
jgi:hypothetical protein